MKITKSLAALTLTALLGLTACGSEQAAPDAPAVDAAGKSSSPTATATESAEPKEDEPERSDRGNLIKEIGQGAGVYDLDSKDPLATFVVNAIEVDPVCNAEYAADYPPENGHLLALDVSIETFPELAESDWPTFSLNPYSMKIVAPNGTTSNAELSTMATYNCFDDSVMVPSAGLGPAEKATGKIVLDSEVPAGTLIITQGGTIGWEYEFGSKPAV